MKNKLFAFILTASMLFGTSAVYAQTNTDTTVRTDVNATVSVDGTSDATNERQRLLDEQKRKQDALRNQIQENKAEFQNTRSEIRQDGQDTRAEIKDVRNTAVTELRTDAQNTKAELRTDAQVMRKEGLTEEEKDMLRDKRTDSQEGLSEKRALLLQKLFNDRHARIQAYFERTVKRIRSAMGRLAGLEERIEARIVLLEEKNKNISTDEAKRYLALAVEERLSAQASLEEAVKLLADVDTSDKETARGVYEQVKKLLRESVKDIRDAHQALKNAIRSLKALPEVRTDVQVDTSVDVEAEGAE